jgi:hypothetical protein
MMRDKQSTPSIRIFPDFGGFTHRIVYPNDHWENPGKYPSSSELVSARLEDKLISWEHEFEICAFPDHFQNKPGTMLWISFDLAGAEIAKQIKKHVGDRASVLYLKPIESPYHRYDTAREVMANGELVTLNYRVGWHNLMVSGGDTGIDAD